MSRLGKAIERLFAMDDAVWARHASGWTVEMAVPFDALGATPKPGDVWGVNVMRLRRAENGDSLKSARILETWLEESRPTLPRRWPWWTPTGRSSNAARSA